MASRNSQARGAWQRIPVATARVLRPRIDGIAGEMVETIRREVAGYRRPPDSDMGRDLVEAVGRAIRQFVDLIEDPSDPREEDAAFFRRLGRVEFRNGRDLDDLQAAYRVGARVACRRYAEIAQAAGLSMEAVLALGEAVLVHINQLANESVGGYAEAKAHTADDLPHRRQALADRLLRRDPDADGASLEFLAFQARWPLPERVACVVTERPEDAPWPHGRPDEDVLVLPRGGELTLVVPGAGVEERVDRLRRALRGQVSALGPAVPLREAWLSRYCACLALRHTHRGALPADEMVVAADNLVELFLLNGEHLGRLLSERSLATLAALSPGKAARLEETFHALLVSWSRSAPEIATALGIHPQTVRYRLRQLEDIFGDRLADPDFRFEAELVMRLRALERPATPPRRVPAPPPPGRVAGGGRP